MQQIGSSRLLGLLAVLVGLIALSALVESPITAAAPNLFAGSVVLYVAWHLVSTFGVDRTISTLTATAFAVGGLTVLAEGLLTLAGRALSPAVIAAGDLAFVAGLVLFLYDWQFVR